MPEKEYVILEDESSYGREIREKTKDGSAYREKENPVFCLCDGTAKDLMKCIGEIEAFKTSQVYYDGAFTGDVKSKEMLDFREKLVNIRRSCAMQGFIALRKK